MTDAETKAWLVVHALRDSDIQCVIAGGAARDFQHDKVPKDYDVFIIGDASLQEVRDALYAYSIDYVEYSDEDNAGEHSMDGSPHLSYVFKAMGAVDIIAQSDVADTPEEVVEGFDCTLNMAWFISPKRVHVHMLYPFPGDMVEMLPKCDDPVARSCYLSQKYPEYKWPTTCKPPSSEVH